jgi:SAM-dependent methyltransferase
MDALEAREKMHYDPSVGEKTQPAWDAGWTALLACPACEGSLSADQGSGLRCTRCARLFPVHDRVPVLLLDPTSRELKTQELYGDIWDRHKPSPRQGGYRAPATSHIELLKLASGSELVQGSAGIDAGCGNGGGTLAMAARHAGLRFIGVDLAGSLPRAAAKAQDRPNLRYVQGNLMQPPLARHAFDFAYSFGVLHHTRDPYAAFRALLERLRPGGLITLFVYKDFSDLPLKRMLLAPVTLVRRVSTRMPAPWLRRIALWTAPVVFITLTLPARLLRALRLGTLARHIPYGTFPGIRGIAASLEDRFGAPYEHRFRIADLQEWARAAGLEEARIVDCLPWGFSGLVLSGRVPGAPPPATG